MNETDQKRIALVGQCKAQTGGLRFNGDVAIQACSDNESTRGPILVKDNTLLFVINGSVQVRFGAAVHTIEKNHMILFKKDILVEYSTNSQTGYQGDTKFIRTYFKYEVLKEFVKFAQLSVPSPEHQTAVTIDFIHTRLLKFIESLQLYLLEPERIDEYLTKLKLLELLFNLAQVESAILPQLMDLRPHFRGDITTTVEDNITSPMSLAQLAELTGRSLSSFKRDFLAVYNMPPSTWVRQRRLEKARELLLNTTMTVTDVCYTLGFENLAHFSRLFKSRFGYSPSKSRLAILQVA
jgi:AraC-like DNA-binding protein